MSWVDEQIRLRKIKDEQIFSESLMEAAGTVLGKKHLYVQDDRMAFTGDSVQYRDHQHQALR